MTITTYTITKLDWEFQTTSADVAQEMSNIGCKVMASTTKVAE